MPPAHWKEEKKEAKKMERNLLVKETIELVLRAIISANQFSIYEAVADLCKEVSKDSQVAGKPAANKNLESMVIPTEFPTADPHTNAEIKETCCKILSISSNNYLKTRSSPNCAPTLV